MDEAAVFEEGEVGLEIGVVGEDGLDGGPVDTSAEGGQAAERVLGSFGQAIVGALEDVGPFSG